MLVQPDPINKSSLKVQIIRWKNTCSHWFETESEVRKISSSTVAKKQTWNRNYK